MNKAKPPDQVSGGAVFRCREPDDDLLSHGDPHYHWREVVSRSCSGWEGVVPTCYGRQAKTFCSDALRAREPIYRVNQLSIECVNLA